MRKNTVDANIQVSWRYRNQIAYFILMLHQRLCSDNSMFSFRNEINMAIQMELILDVFYQCNIIHTTDFFPMKITRSPFSLVPFLFKFCLKIPDCDQYKSRRRLSGNGCGYSKHHISKFLHFLEQMKIFSIHVIH